MLWAPWLRRPKHSWSALPIPTLSWDLGRREDGPPLSRLLLTHLFLSSPTFLFPPPPCLLPCPHCLSSLPSLTTVLLGFFLTFSFNVLTSLSPLLSRPSPALLCVSQCLRFWLFSLSFLPTEQTEAREVTPSHVPGGKRGDFHTFLSLSELDHCHCKMGRQAIAPGCTSEAGPGSRQESSCILCPRTVLEVVEAREPGRAVRGLAKALGSRPCVLCCTALSSLTSPSEHTASSHTSKVKCGCFNH